MRRAIRLLVTLVFGLTLFAAPRAVAAPAADPDHQPCVAGVEWALAARGTMSQIEAAWEVTGLGHVVATFEGGTQVIKQYPYCGHTQDEAFIQVFYERNLSGAYMSYSFTRWVYGGRHA